jgi:hypothetical protein
MDKTCKPFQNGNLIIVGDNSQHIIINIRPWWGKQKDINLKKIRRLQWK